MNRYSKLGKVSKKGAVDSKYFGDQEQFEKDIEAKLKKSEDFKESLRALIMGNGSDMESNYLKAIEVLRELKETYDL